MVIPKISFNKSSLRIAGRRTAAVLSIAAVLFGLATSLVPPKASAATLINVTQNDMANASYTWVNESNITLTVNGASINFFDEGGIQNHSTRDDYYRFINNDTCKPSTIWASSIKPGKVNKIDLHYQPSANGNCATYDNHGNPPPNAALAQIDQANITYNINGATIQRIDGAKWYTFNRASANPNLYVMPVQGSRKSCMDTIVVTPGSDMATLWELSDKDQGKGKAPTGIGADGCYISDKTDDINGPKMTGHLSDDPKYQCPAAWYDPFDCSDYKPDSNGSFAIHMNGPAPQAPTPGDTGRNPDCTTGFDAQGNCQPADDILNCNSGNMNWIICPFITLGAKAANSIDSFIMNTLDIDVSGIFDVTTPASQGYYKAWNSFRVLAIAFLVIAGLVMVASQAIGLEMLDAYTIRKVLPRLLVAIVGISLSWQLMRLAVDFFDTVGVDVRELIYSPFSGLHATISTGAGFLTSATTLGVLFAMGAPALTFIVTALLGVAVGYLILVLRQVALVLLIIIAPIGIACYILPGTQKGWKLWWENFMGLLLMFPIISGLIAAGHAFSAVALKGDGGFNNSGSLAATAFAIIAYFLPYFLLPMAARMATGAIGTLAGMVNDRSKGMFDRLKKSRSDGLARRKQQWRNGELGSELLGTQKLYNRMGVNNLGKRVNAGAQGLYGFGARGKQRMATGAAIAFDQAIKEDPYLSKFAQGNDDGNAVLGLSGGTRAGAEAIARKLFTNADGTYDEARGKAAVAAAASIGFSQRKAGAALMGLAQNKSRAVGAGRVDIIREGIDNLAGGNAQLADELAGTFAYYSRGVGRADFGGMDWAGNRAEFNRQADELARDRASGGVVTAQDRLEAQSDIAMLDGLKRTKVSDIVGGTGKTMEQALATSARFLTKAAKPEQKLRAATNLLEFQQNMSGATDENKLLINQALQDLGISYEPGADGTSPAIVEQLAAKIGVDAATLSRSSRTYGADVPIGAREATPPAPTTTSGDEH